MWMMNVSKVKASKIILPKKRKVIKSAAMDYDDLRRKLDKGNINSLDFLSNLYEFDLQNPDFGSSSFMGGRAAREDAEFDSSILERELDICQLIRSVTEDKHLVPKDVRIDDSDLPQSKNFYEWVTKDEFAGNVLTPFVEQLIICVVLLAEYCPDCTDVEWLIHDHKVDDTLDKFEHKVQLFEHGDCPACGLRRSKAIQRRDVNFYRELAVRAGQRSGKTATIGGMLSPYITHKFLKMQKPTEIYSLPKSQVLHGTFVALTYAQAKETLWDFFYGTLVESKWFQQYHAMLRYYENKYGEKLLKFNDTFVQYRARNLLIYPSGPDKRVLRGKTRFLACITGDSLISTDQGLIRMDTVRVGYRVNVGNKSAAITHHECTDFKCTKLLHLATGQTLNATPTHEILCWDDREEKIVKIKLAKIRGKKVVFTTGGEFPRSLELKGHYVNNSGGEGKFPTYMTPDLAKLMGYMMFCTMSRTGEYTFTTMDHAIFDDFAHTFHEVFGLKVQQATIINGKHKVVIGGTVARFFTAFGLSGMGIKQEIPWSILRSSQTAATSYVRAVAEYSYERHSILLKTLSHSLSSQFQMLLLRLNVVSSITKQFNLQSGYRGGDLYEYSIRLDKEFFTVFKETIGYKIKNVNSVQFVGKTVFTRINDCTFWTDVARLETTRTRPIDVYDMTVDMEEHAYMANGILVSNSIDELGWFDNQKDSSKVKINGHEVYIALERSLLTIRNSAEKLIRSGYDDAMHGLFLNVSSPSSFKDKITEITKKSVNSRYILGIVRPTWDINPTITREDLEPEFQANYSEAMRDYGAEPSLSGNPFIGSPFLIETAIGNKKNGLIMKHLTKKSPDKTTRRYGKLIKARTCLHPCVLGIDAGLSNNSFSATVASAKDGFKVEAFFEVIPKQGVPLNHTLIFDELIYPVIKKFNVKLVVADRWNSVKLLSDVESLFDIHTRIYSLKYRDLVDVRTIFEQHDVSIPATQEGLSIEQIVAMAMEDYPHCFEYKPVEHFILQALTVQDTGTSVIKGDGDLTDDVWRSFCIAVWASQQEEYQEILMAEDIPPATKLAIAVSKLNSGGGSAVGYGGGKQSFVGISQTYKK